MATFPFSLPQARRPVHKRIVVAIAARLLIFLTAGLLAMLMPICARSSIPVQKPPGIPIAGQSAPAFALAGADGKPHKLADFKGRPVVLFFFCGCQWCQQCAEAWGQMQRSGALAPANQETKASANPITLVVYAGDSSAVRDFAQQEGLDPAQTVLLPDEEMKVTIDAYHAQPCPRVFVLDGRGVIRYTNNHKDDAPRKAPALAILSRTIDAVRACEQQSTTAKP